MNPRHVNNQQRAAWYGALCAILCAGSVLVAGEPELTDRAISEKIAHEISSDEGVRPSDVDVATNNGIVTLSGTVNNILSKERATKIAELVRGVRSVVNRIEVKPSQYIPDHTIKTEVKSALSLDPATDAYKIYIEADAGRVTLRGTVDSHKEKFLCGLVAKAVNGVKDLNNEIQVDHKYKRRDLEIRHEIKKALQWNLLVDDTLISVAVDDGNVQLSGTVGSAAERREARWTAWVAGVRSVDDSGLNVVGWLRDEKMRDKKYAKKTDDEIRDAIQTALLEDPRTWAFKVGVEVEDGHVTLGGTVDNLKSKRAAEQVTRNTVGVRYVENRLTVTPEKPVGDETVESNIRRALANDPMIDPDAITISVSEGIVTLFGSVDTYFEKAQAEDVASRVPGAVSVRNNLLVADDAPYAFDPYLDDATFEADWFNYKPDVSLTADSDLKTKVEQELYWSPFVNEEDVNIEVEGGRVTLTGTVGSPAERRNAEMNAWQAGADVVENKLEWR